MHKLQTSGVFLQLLAETAVCGSRKGMTQLVTVGVYSETVVGVVVAAHLTQSSCNVLSVYSSSGTCHSSVYVTYRVATDAPEYISAV